LKATPQVTVKHEEDVQANAITRAQKQREEAEATNGEKNNESEV